jgi:hypothetical protein
MLVLFFIIASASYASEKAVIDFADTVYDFGTVKKGTVVRHDFEFVNAGNSVLFIKDLVAS